MQKKYLVKPGVVRSRADGDRRYISFSKLIELYQVDRRQCVNYENFSMRGFGARQYLAGLIVLEPREDGEYNVPTV